MKLTEGVFRVWPLAGELTRIVSGRKLLENDHFSLLLIETPLTRAFTNQRCEVFALGVHFASPAGE